MLLLKKVAFFLRHTVDSRGHYLLYDINQDVIKQRSHPPKNMLRSLRVLLL